jgi:hypothetical protein
MVPRHGRVGQVEVGAPVATNGNRRRQIKRRTSLFAIDNNKLE